MNRRADAHELAAAARLEAAALLREIAQRRVGDTVKVAIASAAALLGWSYSRTEDIWRGEARRIDSWEMDLLRRAARKLRRHRRSRAPAGSGA